MFNKYYENELQKLREQAVEFAKTHPATAPLLSGPSMDPGAERMLEGVAFLSGMLHQKLDDEFHKFIQETIEIIYPHFVRPLPSLSIVLFEPKSGQTDPVIVKSGTLLGANKIDGTSCQFQTLFDIEVNPVRVVSAQSVQISEKISQLQITLELSGTNVTRWNPKHGLHFFLGGTYTQSTNIFMLLHHYLKQIIVKAEGSDNEFVLSTDALNYIGFNLNNQLLDFPVQSFSAFRMLQEYFILPQKFTLMSLSGLEKWKKRGQGNRFSIYFELNNIPNALPRITKDSFIFNCAPVINLFKYQMEPINLDHRTEKILLRPNSQYPNHYQVYDIESVTGYRTNEHDKKIYKPMSSFKGLKSGQPIYQLLRGRSIINNAPEASLFFPYKETLSNLSAETLSITLTCTNGRLTEKLKVGDICQPTFSSPESISFRNITQPTYSIEPPADVANLWRFISHLSMNFLSIANLENLKELLKLYVSSEDMDKPRLATNQKRVEGITALKATSVDSIFRGIMMRGQQIDMEVDSTQFAELGDVYLFGTLMDHFFSAYTSMNIYTQFNLKEINSGVTFKWKPRVGNRILI